MSLFFPQGAPASVASRAGAPSAEDLALQPIVAALDADGHQRSFIATTLVALIDDPATIAFRQQILDDLLRLPALVAALRGLLPKLRGLSDSSIRRGWGDEPALLRVAMRLGELDAYVSCVEGLASALDDAPLASAGLIALREAIARVRAQPDYRQLAAALPELRAQLDHVGSVTLGVNLDAQFRPESATIVAISGGRFAARAGLLERLLGPRPDEDTTRGIGSLHRAASERAHSAEHALFRELTSMLERVVAPVLVALDRYRLVSSRWLAAVEPEMAFFLGAAQLFAGLRADGFCCCCPEIAPTAERRCVITGSYSLDLALRLRAAHGLQAAQIVVANAVMFDEQAHVLLLTGPNSGGKTTYTRAVGQAQVLFQAGLLVPGRRARMSPVDGIFSHFAAAERPEQEGGRLEEELARLATIFAQVSRDSLLLINEPFTSTDHGAARLLARDLLAGLRLLSARALYVTHLHELVEEALPEGDCANGVASLVAGASEPAGHGAAEPAPTYRVLRGRPRLLGYAAALAQRYGLSREQIAAQLRERGIN